MNDCPSDGHKLDILTVFDGCGLHKPFRWNSKRRKKKKVPNIASLVAIPVMKRQDMIEWMRTREEDGRGCPEE